MQTFASTPPSTIDAVQGFAMAGGVRVVTQGLNSTTQVQGSYPLCRVSVFASGTTELSPIFDALGNPIPNPFTANMDGSWLFYAGNGVPIDVVMDGGSPLTFSQPFTLTGIIPGGRVSAEGGAAGTEDQVQTNIGGFLGAAYTTFYGNDGNVPGELTAGVLRATRSDITTARPNTAYLEYDQTGARGVVFASGPNPATVGSIVLGGESSDLSLGMEYLLCTPTGITLTEDTTVNGGLIVTSQPSAVPQGSAAFYFVPSGTSGAGTAHIDVSAMPGMGMPAMNFNGIPGDGTPFWTFMRFQTSVAAPGITLGVPEIEMPSQLSLFNEGFNSWNVFIGQYYLTGRKGMTIWARASVNAIDFQGETIGGAYDQTIRLNNLGGSVEVGPVTFDAAGDVTGVGSLSVGGTATLSQDPTLPLEAATKQYVDKAIEESGNFVFPNIGIAVSTGTGWATSIDPANVPLLNASINAFAGTLSSNVGILTNGIPTGSAARFTVGTTAGSAFLDMWGVNASSYGGIVFRSYLGNGSSYTQPLWVDNTGSHFGPAGQATIDLSGYGTFSGGLQVTGSTPLDSTTSKIVFSVVSSQPEMVFVNAAAPADSKISDVYADSIGGTLHFRLANDARSTTLDWMTVTRTGYTPTGITLNASSATCTGNLGVSGIISTSQIGIQDTATGTSASIVSTQPNMVSGANTSFFIGQTNSVGNIVYYGFNYVGNASPSNQGTIGFAGASARATFDPVGDWTFPANVTVPALIIPGSGYIGEGGNNLVINAQSNTNGSILLNWNSGATGGTWFGNGSSAVVANVSSTGVITGTAKNFAIPHPLDKTKKLVHACIEGPEIGVYYRGKAETVDGVVTITLPIYFEALTRKEDRTIILTERYDDEDDPVVGNFLAAGPIRDGSFNVRSITRSVKFYWEVKAVRADIEPLEVEPVKTEGVNDAGANRTGAGEAGKLHASSPPDAAAATAKPSRTKRVN